MKWDEYWELVNSAEQKWQNKYVLANYPGTKLSKVNIDHLEEILEVIEAVVPKERVWISHWDTGLVAVGVGGIAEVELTQMLKRLKTNLETRRTWSWDDSFDRQSLHMYICYIWGLLHADYRNSPAWSEIDKL